jgi:hypothetical protein
MKLLLLSETCAYLSSEPNSGFHSFWETVFILLWGQIKQTYHLWHAAKQCFLN